MFSPDSRSQWRSVLLGALIIFLPLSAWLVSLTGRYEVGMIRDLLLGLFLLLTVADYRSWRRPTAGFWLAAAFTIAVLLSFFTREDSVAQFLRGVRFLAEPLLLFGAVSLLPPANKTVLWRAFADNYKFIFFHVLSLI